MPLRASVVVATLVLGSAAAAKPSKSEAADLEVRVGKTVEMIVNDRPVRFHIAPDAISVPTLNADTAKALGLKPSMIGYIYVIGPVKIGFRTDDVRYGTGDTAFRSRTAFSARQVAVGADGVAGPATFASRRTIFTLRDPQPGDRAISFPIDKDMGRSQTGVKIMVDGRPIHAAFSFDRAESLVTATGGRWIADANGGRFDGAARQAPILYGVSRPVRTMRLERPLMLGDLKIRRVAVRVSDVGSAEGIAEGAASDQDPNEIVVTADSKRKPADQRLYVGMDTIGHCASVTYDFAAGTVTLMCPEQPAAALEN